MIGQAPRAARVRTFGRYNAVAFLAGAVGSLAAGGPAVLRDRLPGLPADQRWLLLFPVIALSCVGLAGGLSPAVEAHGDRARTAAGRSPLGPSRGVVARLGALFALDSFAGGFVVQSFVVFWFRRRFGVEADLLGLVFFAAGVLQAASSIAAAWLGARFGLLRTMVFTHLPSNVLLALVPAAPTFGSAVAVLLARFGLSQMDVPTRQAYLAAIVEPEERAAAAAFTNTARYVTRPAGPVLGGALMRSLAVGAPFVISGVLKVVYDLALWATFRRVRLPDEPATPPPG